VQMSAEKSAVGSVFVTVIFLEIFLLTKFRFVNAQFLVLLYSLPVNLRDPKKVNLSLKQQDFINIDFLLYRSLRLLLFPFGKYLSMKVSTHLHWIFRHLSIATSSHYYGVDFLNSRSAVIQGQLLERHLNKGDFVVDVACGSARYLPTLKMLGVKNYLGLDSSSDHIERNIKLFPEVHFKLCNALEQGAIPGCDVVIASHFLEHLTEPDKFLSQISDLCKKLVIEVPDFFADPVNLVSFSLGSPWWTDRDHKREYSVKSIEELLEHCGYQVIEKCLAGGTIGVVAVPN
jgi:ubiquinone/menaquinone biosynthesis C-methylase UbiE